MTAAAGESPNRREIEKTSSPRYDHITQALTQPDGMRTLGKNQFLPIEGAGRLDHVTIEGDNAKIEVLKDGFNGPTAVTQVGNTAWVLEGKLKYMNDPKFKDQDPGPFKVYAVPIGK